MFTSQDGTLRVPLSRGQSKKLNQALAQNPEYAQQRRLFFKEGSVHVHKRSAWDVFRRQPKNGAYLSMDSTTSGHSKIMKLQKEFTDFLVKHEIISQEKADKMLAKANRALISGKGFVTRKSVVQVEKTAAQKAGKAVKIALMIGIPATLGILGRKYDWGPKIVKELTKHKDMAAKFFNEGLEQASKAAGRGFSAGVNEGAAGIVPQALWPKWPGQAVRTVSKLKFWGKSNG